MSNTGTVKIALKIDDKGVVKGFRQIGKESETAGDKGARSFKKMDRASNDLKAGVKKTTATIVKMGGAVAGIAAVAMAWQKLSAVVSESVDLAKVQEAAERKLESVLVATGHAAGFNLDQLKAMASGFQEVTRFGDEVTMSAMAILATFKEVRVQAFERATEAAMDMSTILGQDLNSAILQIGKALNDPTVGLTALGKAGVSFTATQKELIKTLQKSGDMMGAQEIILKELESEFGGAARAAVDEFAGGLDQANNALGDTKEELGFIITKNQTFIELTHRAKDAFVEWGKQIQANREALMALVTGGVMKVSKSLGIMADGFSMFWQIASSPPAGLIQYFSNLSDEIKKSTEEIDKLNTSIEAIEPPDPTALDSFLNFLEKWGLDCIEVFAFIGKSVAAILGVILADGAEVVRLLAEEFMSLGSIIWKTLSFDFGGAKKAFGSLGNISETFLQNVEKNYAAYEKTIDEGWAKMLANMSSNTKNTDLTIDWAGIPFIPAPPDIPIGEYTVSNKPEPTAAEIAAAEKKAATIASLYQSAYSALDTMTQATYDAMAAQYQQDYDTFVKATGDKVTAQAIYARKVDALNDKMYGSPVDTALDAAFGDIDAEAARYNQLMDEGAQVTINMRTSTEQLGAEIAHLNELLKVEAINAEIYGRAVAKAQDDIAGSSVDDALEGFFSNIDKETDRLASSDYWSNFLESMEHNMMNMDELVGSTLESWSGQFGDFFASAVLESDSLGDAFSTLAQGMATSMVSAIGQMIAQWLVYQATKLLVDKSVQAGAAVAMTANAQAASLQAGINAYASAAAIPITGWAVAPGAMAAALAVTAPMAAAIAALASTAAVGMAHEGIDSVPKSGTWLLEKGERVTTESTSKRLDTVLTDIQARLAGGGTESGPVVQSSPKIVNVWDESMISDHISSGRADKVIINRIKKNASTIKNFLN